MNVEQEINSIADVCTTVLRSSYKIDLEKLTSDGKFAYERYFPQLYSKSISDNT